MSISFLHNRSKLDPMAIKCIFIGYSSNQKGYKCYSPITRHFYNSMDVTFFEQEPFYTKTNIQGGNFSKEYQLWDITPTVVTTPTATTPQVEAVISLDEHTLSPSPTSTPASTAATTPIVTTQVKVVISPD